MNSYSVFAEYYDQLTDDVDYAKYAAYFAALFHRYGMRPEIVLDLACGTGSLGIELAGAGMEVIGVDRSPQMLSKAAEKAGGIHGKTMFICQDMRELDLYGTVDAAVCLLDGVNHLTDRRDLARVFEKVSLFLNPGGAFIFDLNTPYKIAEILGNNTFVYDYDDFYCVWQNSYRETTRLCRFELNFFVRSGEIYRRYDEAFSERAYTPAQIRNLLRRAGFDRVDFYEDLSFEAPSEHSQRIFVTARKET